jgi:hypothetical protein
VVRKPIDDRDVALGRSSRDGNVHAVELDRHPLPSTPTAYLAAAVEHTGRNGDLEDPGS